MGIYLIPEFERRRNKINFKTKLNILPFMSTSLLSRFAYNRDRGTRKKYYLRKFYLKLKTKIFWVQDFIDY